MRIGLQIPSFTWPGGSQRIRPLLADIAQAVDESGFDSLWVMDHFFQIQFVGEPNEPMLEGYSVLSYLAGKTKNVRLGTLVTGVIYRHPGILVKTASTLDVLSGGRAYFGIGAAWNEYESKGLGVPFPPVKERFERLEEALQIALQMWSGIVEPFQGRYYQLEQTLNIPQPISKPHPPILIGGTGEKKTLRLVAKYGDACNFFSGMGMDVLRHKLDVLRRHCDEVGRPYSEIEKTVLGGVDLRPGKMTAGDAVNHCKELANLGFTHFIFNMPDSHEIEPLRRFAREVLPAVKDL
jgi:F420-dependent oxidoreductase-like protein